ncbi:MAG: hypothetical protein ACT4QA_18395 [Panacagrimonas sp.]
MATAATPEPRCFYLVSTPYHCLLALAHAESRNEIPVLFLFGRFPSASDYLRVLGVHPPLLPGLVVEGLTGSADDRGLRRGARGRLLQSLSLWKPGTLVVFNDRHDLSQVALDWAQRDNARRLCFEDGSSFYTDWLAPPASAWTRWRKRLFTTRNWEPIRVLGTHPALDAVLAQRPQAVRAELRGRVQPLSLDLPRSPVLRALAEGLVREEDRSSALDGAPDVLVLPALNADAAWTLAATGLIPKESNIAFKYHPREAASDPAGLRGLGMELPRHLPVELLYLLWGGGPGTLIGDGRSTTLLTAGLFDGRTRIIGLYAGAALPQAEVYARLGIELAPSAID